MDKNRYDSDYLNESFAFCVLGLGMMFIAMGAVGAHGWSFLLFCGFCLGNYGCGRLTIYSRQGPNRQK